MAPRLWFLGSYTMGRFQREGYSIEFNCKIIMMQDFGGEPRWAEVWEIAH